MNAPSPTLLGSYILFKQLEVGSLSELWRAGRLDEGKVTEIVALRRFRGGDARALRAAAGEAKGVVGQIQGSAVVRGQRITTAEGHVLLEHEYSGGRSLQGILERATSGENGPHPIPVDQALAIAERLAASAEALQQVRLENSRLVHGAIVPQFVWITEDGEVRLAGHLLAKGILASLKDQEIRTEIAPYIAPELRTSSIPTASGDIYSIGAILFLTLTGSAPPAQKAEGALDEARLMFDDEPVPTDLMPILRRTLATDPAQRFGSITELHQAIQKLVAGGLYAPTTFNLAFYLHTLLKREMEIEAGERKAEAAVDVASLMEQKRVEERAAVEPRLAGEDSSAPRSAPIRSPLSGGMSPEESRSKLPLIAAAIVVLALLGSGGFWLMKTKSKVPAAQAASAPVEVASAAIIEAPIVTAVAEPTEEDVVDPDLAATTSEAAADEEEERRKAFEEEVNRRLREEVTRLQSDYERQIAAERAKIVAERQPQAVPQTPARTAEQPPAAAAATETKAAEPRLDADSLNQQRLQQIETERESEPGPAETATAPLSQTQTATVSAPVPAVTTPPPPPAVRQGDLIDLATLDKPPALVKSVPPTYPPMARKQRLEATVIISVLISENGDVLEARVLRGDPRGIGFDEAAVAAAKASKFSPPMKDGLRVRTWLAYPYRFQLSR